MAETALQMLRRLEEDYRLRAEQTSNRLDAERWLRAAALFAEQREFLEERERSDG